MAKSPSKLKMLERTGGNQDDVLEIFKIISISFGIILFMALTLVTMFSMIGVMKTIYVWSLLTSDIKDEPENKQHTSANVDKLNKSLEKESMYSSLCLIFAGFGFQLCCASMILLYGLFKTKLQAIYAWIIFSFTNIGCLTVLLLFLHNFTRMPVTGTGIACNFSYCVCILTIYNLFLWYYTKLLGKCEQKIVVKAYGGFTHTVSPILQLPEKPQENNIV